MADIKIIALDLDGTLLNSEKELSRENYRALEEAAAQGIEIVPTTGRFYNAMPQVIRDPGGRFLSTLSCRHMFLLKAVCYIQDTSRAVS